MLYLFTQKLSWNVLLNVLQFHTIKDLILNMCPDTFSSIVILNRGSQPSPWCSDIFILCGYFPISDQFNKKCSIELTVDKMDSLSQKSCLLFLKHLILWMYGFWQKVQLYFSWVFSAQQLCKAVDIMLLLDSLPQHNVSWILMELYSLSMDTFLDICWEVNGYTSLLTDKLYEILTHVHDVTMLLCSVHHISKIF